MNDANAPQKPSILAVVHLRRMLANAFGHDGAKQPNGRFFQEILVHLLFIMRPRPRHGGVHLRK